MKNSLVEMFNLSATHNNVKCIESIRPEDKGTKNQFWFSIKMLCKFFDVAERTLRDNLKSLMEDGEIVDSENSQTTVVVEDSLGRDHSVIIYNLEVLNKLGMCCFRGNKQAKEIRDKFNDVLVEKETKKFPIPETFEDALILAGQQMKLAKEEERKRIQAETERDEAIRTKAMISSKREATAVGRLGGTAKALNAEKKKNTELLKENVDLIKEKEELKIRLSESEKYKTVKQMTGKLSLYLDTKNNKNLQKIGKIVKQISLSLEKEVKKVDDLNFEKVNSYHVSAWKELFIRLNNDPYYLIEMRK